VTDQPHGITDTSTRVSWLPGSVGQQGALSVALSAALWGLFWIPLRFLDEHGVSGVTAVALVMFVGIIPSALILYRVNKLYTLKSAYAWCIGSSLGLSIVLYFTGVIISDVIRVIFLFYLLPIWTTLAARVLYGEPVTRLRLLVIVLALIGLWLLLGGGNQFPVPSNLGDWCGLFAGITWGISLAVIRGKEGIDATAMVFTTTVGATIIALVAAILLSASGNSELVSINHVASWGPVLMATTLFAIFLLFPVLMGQVWGAQRVAAPTAALLTMTEVLVATLSAYWLIGTELNSVSMFGAAIILTAVLIDVAVQYVQESTRQPE